MVIFEAEPSRALFIIRYEGKVTSRETRENALKLAGALAPFSPGFRLLADLTNLISMEITCAPDIERFMDLCQEKGIAEIVRVIPDPTRDIGLQIMSRFHYKSSVRIVTCRTLAEATTLLEHDH